MVQITTIIDFNKDTKLAAVNTLNETVALVSYNDMKSLIEIYYYGTGVTETKNEEEFMEWAITNNHRFKTLSGNCWVKYNANKDKKNTIDCTLRAYCKAEGISWDEAFDIAAKIAKQHADMPDSSKIVERVLVDHFHYELTTPSDKKKTVNQFALEHPTGTYILGVRSHVVALVDGKFYDTWDSGTKKINRIFKKN